MSVLMRRENTLIIEPGSDISKIQIINFILLPNSKKHFEGPPLQEQKQITRKDSGTLHGDNLANLQITIETALEQSSISDTQNYDITNGRKLMGILLISLFSIICTVGVYMNGVDVIHAMIK
ncbi:Hypothetical_protein [Hexamita inflata]|uniref:Hypothetical_protein n=1 Tax=Hexamita inflata TaxID=28002 RepID=A0AA86Q614_9EUKA|nr:Hypothetical protein HINF_LOCUS39523 [Hexamita inflata]